MPEICVCFFLCLLIFRLKCNLYAKHLSNFHRVRCLDYLSQVRVSFNESFHSSSNRRTSFLFYRNSLPIRMKIMSNLRFKTYFRSRTYFLLNSHFPQMYKIRAAYRITFILSVFIRYESVNFKFRNTK